MENRSPQWAKNAANAAKKRAMNRTKSRGPMSGSYSVDKYGGVTSHTVRNKEGREYRVARTIYNSNKQISGPPMPSAWLPESGYGASPRPGPFTRDPPRPPVYVENSVPHNDGNVEYAGPFTRDPPRPPVYVENPVPHNDGILGGRRRTRSRKTRSRKTRRRHR